MFTEISEQEFFSLGNNPIQYIGIYELDWLMDDNLLDCEGIIIAFENRKILISSKEIGEDDFDFIYYDFPQRYDCRKILSSPDEPVCFVRKEEEEEASRTLRFQVGYRPILVMAYENKWLTVGLSHWDVNGEWMEYEKNNLLNDYF